MTLAVLARRSLRFYLRSHLGAVFGAAIATAVLTGALLVGDSVRGTLRDMALARIGAVDQALASGDRLFRAAIAGEIEKQIAPGSWVVPVLQVPGTAVRPDGGGRANNVQVSGAGPEFFKLAPHAMTATLAGNDVWINERLANQLKAKAGDVIVLRVPRISHLSRDAPLSPEEDSTVALRLELKRVLSDGEFGRFGLAASQIPPFNAFVPLALLQTRVNATNQANILLSKSSAADLNEAFKKAFTLADAQLSLRLVPGTNSLELRSSRVFLDQQVSSAALQAVPSAKAVMTYFVNRLRAGTHTTPYSMVAGTTLFLPPDMREDEIVINQWLADDLQAKAGDSLTLSYFVMGLMRDLVERTNSFRIRAVVPMERPWVDPALMPDFPGMTDAANCRDWDTGFPIDTDAIREKDEDYWHKFRGAPKAFVTLKAAQEMWSNRFGDLTSVRFPGRETNDIPVISAEIMRRLHPRDLGFVFQPIRAQALAASSGAQDFGGLFIGFSFFLIAAALILTSLLFRFALEQRAGEIGTLLALGFPYRRVRRLLLLEALGLSLMGGLIGVALAVLYARAMLYGLSTLWKDAVAGASPAYHGSPVTLATGFVSGILVALLTIWWSLWRETKRSPRELLAEGFDETAAPGRARGSARKTMVAGVIALVLGLGIAGWGLAEGEHASADTFFSAGGLVLVAGFLLASAFIRRLEFSSAARRLTLSAMGIRGIARRRKRSRAAVGLLACGSFLIASIGVFHLDAGKGANDRASGTGGFTLIGESSLPVVHNLNTQAGRDFFGLKENDLQGVQFVPLRVLPGEDASCLNLNRAQKPRLLGVTPVLLSQRGAFTFNKTIEGSSASSNAWLLLNRDFGPDVVPAIGDAASIQWALGKKVGDTIPFTDGKGRVFQLKIVGAAANSILQGNLLISESAFVNRFPAEAGYRMFFIDAPVARAAEISATLTKALQDAGFEITGARERLAEFNAVQNTYLGTFQMLGGLGLLLGSFGLGVILMRNVFERRGELALLLAVGFRKSSLRWLILSEHAVLLVLGLLTGVIAAGIAVLPSILTPGMRLPLAQLAWTLGAVFVCGLVWTIIAAGRALRAPLLNSLRNE